MHAHPTRVLVAALAATLLASCSSARRDAPDPGTYRAASGPNSLTLSDDTWKLVSGPRVKTGIIRHDGDALVFVHRDANNIAYAGQYCRDAHDAYTWKEEGDVLTFRIASEKVPCDVNLFAVLTVAGPWHLVSG